MPCEREPFLEPCTPGGAESRRLGGIAQQVERGLCQRRRVVGGDEPARDAVLDRLPDAADIGRDDRQPRRHRLEVRVGERLRPAGRDEDVADASSAGTLRTSPRQVDRAGDSAGCDLRFDLGAGAGRRRRRGAWRGLGRRGSPAWRRSASALPSAAAARSPRSTDSAPSEPPPPRAGRMERDAVVDEPSALPAPISSTSRSSHSQTAMKREVSGASARLDRPVGAPLPALVK